ncbi:hypothetical protein GRJ2_001718000 [Grus japonensis]|uniref:Uncharacterized protein n=1 Tax=Grus japonensis TaxID=30415 RepID=A0ABC9X511_GRUJA
MEDPTPEQVEAPEGGCGPREAHAGASSWLDRWTREEGSPRQGRFAGRTCDPVGDPTLEQFAPEGTGELQQPKIISRVEYACSVSYSTVREQLPSSPLLRGEDGKYITEQRVFLGYDTQEESQMTESPQGLKNEHRTPTCEDFVKMHQKSIFTEERKP